MAQVGYSKRSRLDKLGVQPGMRVAVLGVSERDFVPELKQRTREIAAARPRQDTALIFFGVERRGAAPAPGDAPALDTPRWRDLGAVAEGAEAHHRGHDPGRRPRARARGHQGGGVSPSA
jgi:hypothetical protein